MTQAAEPTHTTLRQPLTSEFDPAQRPWVYVNGEMYPKGQASVSVFDHGLLYGDGVFEGIRVYNGKIFKLGQHMDRLYECARKIELDLEKHVSRAEMEAIQRRCVQVNGIRNGYIRLVVTRGVGTLGLNPFNCPEPGVICIADQIKLYPEEMYRDGMRVVVAERRKVPVESLDPRIKSLNYLSNILAKVEAIKLGCLEVVMLNIHGQITEGSGDNIFFAKNGELFTPPCDVGALEGITRRFVKDELCPKVGIKCTEKVFGLPELLEADEIFLTGSAAEMIAVRQVDEHTGGKITREHKISDGEGPITAKLRAAFKEVVTGDDVPED